MTTDLQQLVESVNAINDKIPTTMWHQAEFWSGTVLAAFGLYFSIRAFTEARMAKQAAKKAGEAVKIQNISEELSNILHLLDRLDPNIHFNEARDKLDALTRSVRKATSPYLNDQDLQSTIATLRETLSRAKTALENVKPASPDDEAKAPYAVYNAIQSDFAEINGLIADLLGLFQNRTMN